jgi:hypothetical protein
MSKKRQLDNRDMDEDKQSPPEKRFKLGEEAGMRADDSNSTMPSWKEMRALL